MDSRLVFLRPLGLRLLEILCLWEMAGANLAAIASPTVLQPADKNIIEPTLDVMKFKSDRSHVVL